MTGKSGGSTYDEVLNTGSRIKPADSCAFDQAIQLQRVDPEQAKGLSKGRPLSLETRRQNKVTSIVCVRPDNNKYVGSVAFSDVDRLISCIAKGRKYEAKIENIQATAVIVRIYDI
jgi:hypothetical protein